MRAEGFSCSLCVHYGGLRISIIAKKYIKIYNCNFFSIFGHQNPGFGTGSGSAIRKNAGLNSVGGRFITPKNKPPPPPPSSQLRIRNRSSTSVIYKSSPLPQHWCTHIRYTVKIAELSLLVTLVHYICYWYFFVCRYGVQCITWYLFPFLPR